MAGQDGQQQIEPALEALGVASVEGGLHQAQALLDAGVFTVHAAHGAAAGAGGPGQGGEQQLLLDADVAAQPLGEVVQRHARVVALAAVQGADALDQQAVEAVVIPDQVGGDGGEFQGDCAHVGAP